MDRASVKILIVDDDDNICRMLAKLMEKEGFKTIVANDGVPAIDAIRSHWPDVMLLDMKMPEMDGDEVLARSKEIDPDLPVIIITAFGEIQGAVEAIKHGAYDYLAKPFDHDDVLRLVQRSLSERKLKRKLKNLVSHMNQDSPLRDVMGPSEAVGYLVGQINQVAQSEFTVVLQGETGSGKEIVAQAIHKASLRAEKSFVPLDCGAIPEALLESELFGHEKGAFTGAVQKTVGLMAAASGGTLFLDEISNLPLPSQAKLLRVIQERKVYPVGGKTPHPIDVRLLVAANQDLSSLTEKGLFRSDLLYRLREFSITIPPLRQRKDDILYLAKRFLDITCSELNKDEKGFSENALDMLLNYDWPGNVRELRSTVRRAVLLADKLITRDHLDIRQRGNEMPCGILPEMINELSQEKEVSFKAIVRESTAAVERQVLTRTLQATGGNKAKAARKLQIDYKTILTKIKKLGL
ncbi:MAG: sigma-54 dependent transcriptional regulator [Desulfobacteraceae bacterium]|nr:sigma-54 dependent transcriptional regulator [Desulfobacteraceae bacterium]MCF8050326.1 sigma-54 dependent transcriptional regulator [Desulfobacterales bacterium]MCF8080961.1 sigma-54 dependent transcriptional regulator [Desulfobacterales bacterium]